MKQPVRWVLSLACAMALIVVSGCGGGTPASTSAEKASTGPSGAAESVFDLDDAATVARDVTVAGGGGVALKPTEDSIVRVNFPANCLSADTKVALTPLKTAPLDDASIVAPGCMVADVSGKSLAMSGPAFVTYTVAGELPKDTAIIRYAEDGTSFEALPSTVETNGKATAVTAMVDHFSPLALGKRTGKDDGTADYNWVIHITDTYTFSGAMSQKLTLNLTATNSSGKLTGAYKGKASSSTSGHEEMPKGGSIDNVGSAKGTIKLQMTGFIEDPLVPLTDESQPDPLAPLTGPDVPDQDKLAPLEPDDDKLAPLEPGAPKDDGPAKPPGGKADLQGAGSITMAGQGTASATAKGVTMGAGHGGTDTLPVTVFVSGPQVYLYCDFPGDLGRATFRGYIIGEGKK